MLPGFSFGQADDLLQFKFTQPPQTPKSKLAV
jgi:hypothetical protein